MYLDGDDAGNAAGDGDGGHGDGDGDGAGNKIAKLLVDLIVIVMML